MDEKILSAIKNIRKADTGEWLKDCNSANYNCSDGYLARLETMRLLDELYTAAGISRNHLVKNQDETNQSESP